MPGTSATWAGALLMMRECAGYTEQAMRLALGDLGYLAIESKMEAAGNKLDSVKDVISTYLSKKATRLMQDGLRGAQESVYAAVDAAKYKSAGGEESPRRTAAERRQAGEPPPSECPHCQDKNMLHWLDSFWQFLATFNRTWYKCNTNINSHAHKQTHDKTVCA